MNSRALKLIREMSECRHEIVLSMETFEYLYAILTKKTVPEDVNKDEFMLFGVPVEINNDVLFGEFNGY